MLQGVGTSSKGTEETVEASGLMAPGARESRGWAGILRGTLVLGGAEDGRLVGRTAVVVPDERPTHGWKLLEQGPESQAASVMCSGGVSAVMAPPISMDTVLVFRATKTIGVKAHCPDGRCRSNLEVACLDSWQGPDTIV